MISTFVFSVTDRDKQLADRAFDAAKNFIDKNEFEKAKRFLVFALNKNPDHQFALARLVIVLTKLNDYETLVKYYEPYAKKKLDDENVLFNMGTFAMKSNQWEKAVEYLMKVLNKNPQNFKAVYNLSLCHIELKNFQKSIEYSIICVKNNHNKIDALKNIVRAHIELKLWDAGLLYALELVKETNNKDAFALDSLAVIYAGKKDFEKAIESVKKALAIQDVALFKIRLKQYEDELKKKKSQNVQSN